MKQVKYSPKRKDYQSRLVWTIMLCSGLFLGALVALSWLAPDLPAAQHDNVYYEAKVTPSRKDGSHLGLDTAISAKPQVPWCTRS